MTEVTGKLSLQKHYSVVASQHFWGSHWRFLLLRGRKGHFPQAQDLPHNRPDRWRALVR